MYKSVSADPTHSDHHISRRPAARTSFVGLAVLAATLIATGLLDEASAAASKKPSRKIQSTPQQSPAPDVTSTIKSGEQSKKVPPNPSAAPDVEDESIPPPFNLPTASRARMRACGERWQDMKMSGEAKAQTWRAYATNCLASKDGPAKATRP